MRTSAATDAGTTNTPNEDWYGGSAMLSVVVDGATARTDTGCRHNTAWYARRLGIAVTSLAAEADQPLAAAVVRAIDAVAAEHPRCDLTHPGTPSAALAMVRLTEEKLEYLLLGDVTLVLDDGEVVALTDDRVDRTARAEREAVDRFPIGSSEKLDALRAMKHAELAARNTEGGFWVAAADSTVVGQAITGHRPVRRIRRVAVLTDGAARAVTPFALLGWPGVLDLDDPRRLIRLVRQAEADDPYGIRWPRNKRGDDATAVYLSLDAG